MSKARLLHSADNCRALTKYLGDAITVDHVFVLTVYTDFDVKMFICLFQFMCTISQCVAVNTVYYRFCNETSQ